MAPSHYLNQCWNIVNWPLRNKFQWNFNRNSYIFIHENAFEKVVCKMAAILSRPQCLNAHVSSFYCTHNRRLNSFLAAKQCCVFGEFSSWPWYLLYFMHYYVILVPVVPRVNTKIDVLFRTYGIILFCGITFYWSFIWHVLSCCEIFISSLIHEGVTRYPFFFKYFIQIDLKFTWALISNICHTIIPYIMNYIYDWYFPFRYYYGVALLFRMKLSVASHTFRSPVSFPRTWIFLETLFYIRWGYWISNEY